jgi:competence protein ComEA
MLTNKALAMAMVAAVSMMASEAWAKGKGAPKHVTGVANLNTASQAQLDLLPGVGAQATRRIMEHRIKAPFTRTEELVKVKGFGKKKYEKLKPYLVVAGPSTIKLAEGPAPAKDAPAQGRTAPRR